MVESGIADFVLLGNKKRKMDVIRRVKPDIICLGYDQKHFIFELEQYIDRKNLKILVKRLNSHKPHIYKSTIIRKKLNESDE